MVEYPDGSTMSPTPKQRLVECNFLHVSMFSAENQISC